MALTDLAIRAIKPRQRPFKMYDPGGLFMLVNPSGSRLCIVVHVDFLGQFSALPHL